MSNRGYDVVVDVDQEGDLGHTDLQEDLEFHSSNFDDPSSTSSTKIPPDSSTSFLPGPATSSSSNSNTKHYLWTLSFYAQAFDVDTAEVLRRCLAALYPRANFLDVLEGNPDLYGPIWIATTVVVILFLTGTISQYLAHSGKEHFAYDFRLLSGGAGLIYGYTAFVPVGLWAVLRWWFRVEGANLLEFVCLYGYADLVWVPVALVSWSPLSIFNLIFVALGFAASAFFLLRNLYPVLSATDVKTSKILLVVVLALHAGLAIAIKILFFAAGSPVGGPKDTPQEGVGGGDKGERVVRMMMRF
ncbi:Yip1-domain-containing protein [Westerdykella ornata]|uniref:Protein YIP n=1 Tax=Westerdykella ornata TaxID=318751 RepID=A0A6A6JUA7_WESOR|nr:Yip1-domain-containing protein [Westerdykella ornata]KAF2279326.1 Yip1-domain-containing protein [Westerdykella ornata]